MQKEKMINNASKQNSKLDGRPAQSQKKRYHINFFVTVLLFLGDFMQDFPCLAKWDASFHKQFCFYTFDWT